MNYITMHTIYCVPFLEYNKNTINEMTENNKIITKNC